MEKGRPVQGSQASVEELQDEIAALRARVAELEAREAEPANPVDLAELLTSLPAVLRWSSRGMVTQWSAEAERLFGWTSEEAIGQSIIDLFVPENIPRNEAHTGLEAVFLGQLHGSRSMTRTKSGDAILCRWTHSILRDEHGTPVEVVSEIERCGDDLMSEQLVIQSRHILLSVVNNSPNAIYVKDLQSRYVMVNRRGLQMAGRTLEQMIGHTDEAFLPAHLAAWAREQDRLALERGEPLEYEQVLPLAQGDRTMLIVKFPMYGPSGRPIGVCGIGTDITERRQAEAERLALQQQMIEAQRAALRELSTPLVPIAGGVLAMPLVGMIDSVRAAEIMDTLLEGIGRQQARVAILDITGVRVVDTQVANALVGVARAARLLGAEVLLTGISPAVAQTLVGLDLELGGLVTLGTLQSAIAYALRGEAKRAAPKRAERA